MTIATDSVTRFWQHVTDNQLDKQAALDILRENGNDFEKALEALQAVESPPDVVGSETEIDGELDEWFPSQPTLVDVEPETEKVTYE